MNLFTNRIVVDNAHEAQPSTYMSQRRHEEWVIVDMLSRGEDGGDVVDDGGR